MKQWNRLYWLFGLLVMVATSTTHALAPPMAFVGRSAIMSRHSTMLSPLNMMSKNLEEQHSTKTKVNTLEKLWNRLDTLKAAGMNKSPSQPQPLMSGLSFKQSVVLGVVAFLLKWYRARFINKIPVWDRQPQWNMVVTNREQEKKLKAYTCKNCGTTLFIARNREWFFKGDTGIGGLGCFTCGAKGDDNFVMDRDRIVEDVGDDDDYFDYERPLDFVSAAERRALLKKAKGDESVANQMLIDEGNAADAANMDNSTIVDVLTNSTQVTDTNVTSVDGNATSAEAPKKKKSKKKKKKKTATEAPVEEKVSEEVPPEPKVIAPEPIIDDLDALGMDDV